MTRGEPFWSSPGNCHQLTENKVRRFNWQRGKQCKRR